MISYFCRPCVDFPSPSMSFCWEVNAKRNSITMASLYLVCTFSLDIFFIHMTFELGQHAYKFRGHFHPFYPLTWQVCGLLRLPIKSSWHCFSFPDPQTAWTPPTNERLLLLQCHLSQQKSRSHPSRKFSCWSCRSLQVRVLAARCPHPTRQLHPLHFQHGGQ